MENERERLKAPSEEEFYDEYNFQDKCEKKSESKRKSKKFKKSY